MAPTALESLLPAGEIFASLPDYGPIEIGTSVSMVCVYGCGWSFIDGFALHSLLGIVTLQTWNYFRDFPEDPTTVRTMVAAVYLAEVLHSALFVHGVYQFTIVGPADALLFGDFHALVMIPWSLQASLVVVACIVLVVQSYFSLRIWRITQSRVLSLGCWLLALAGMSLNITLAVGLIKDPTLASLESKTLRWQALAELSVGTLCDISMAVCMCIGFLRRRTGFSRTDKLVDKLVAYAIGTGVMTGIVSFTELITFATMPTKLVWVACFSVISKIFSNSLLASLNQRMKNRDVSLSDRPHAGVISTRLEFHRQQGTSGIELSSIPDGGTKTELDTSDDRSRQRDKGLESETICDDDSCQ